MHKAHAATADAHAKAKPRAAATGGFWVTIKHDDGSWRHVFLKGVRGRESKAQRAENDRTIHGGAGGGKHGEGQVRAHREGTGGAPFRQSPQQRDHAAKLDFLSGGQVTGAHKAKAAPKAKTVRERAKGAKAAPAAAKATGPSLREQAAKHDPAAFANKVKAAVHATPGEGWYGDQKVWISHAHAAYEKLHGPMPMEQFKKQLVEGHTGRHLELGRSDNFNLSDDQRQAFKASDTPYLNANYHYVRSAEPRAAAKSLREQAAEHRAKSGLPAAERVDLAASVRKAYRGGVEAGAKKDPRNSKGVNREGVPAFKAAAKAGHKYPQVVRANKFDAAGVRGRLRGELVAEKAAGLGFYPSQFGPGFYNRATKKKATLKEIVSELRRPR